ncbi:MAG: hypothetical protein JWL73_3992 [Actinomycetia bacterium]|nr:hypothetical protein [Actinomycetes bacterium]
MPYPKHLVNEGETVALDLRPHWWYFSKHIFTGVPLFILFLFAVGGLDKGTGKNAVLVLFAILWVAWVVWLLLKYFQWTYTHFVVTSDRVIFRTGVLSKRGIEIPLERINNINFHQGMFERVIGAGDLDIESAGKDGQSHFDDVRHPDAVQQEIYRQMEANTRKTAGYAGAAARGPSAAAPQQFASVPDQIAQLAALRDAGHITQAEFEAKKAQLLDRM